MASESVRGLLAGLAGGTAALGLSFVIRETLGGAFLPEMGAQALFSLTPGSVESAFVVSLQSLAKYSAFAGGVVVNLILYSVLGAFLYRSKAITKSSAVGRFLSFAFLPFIVLVGVGALLLYTTSVQSAPVTLPYLLASLFPPQVAFGGVLLWFRGPGKGPGTPAVVVCNPPTPPSGKHFDRRRRLIVRAGLATAVGGVILAYGIGYLLKQQGSMMPTGGAPGSASVGSLISQQVTPNAKFYRVDVNIFPPEVDSATYVLRVFGLVERPLKLTLPQLRAMSVVEQYNTLECVSNTIGGDLISTAKWTGVRIKDVLGMAGVQASADYVVFFAADGYDVGIPMDRAMLDGALLAFEMNGASLPTEHGSPLRAIVPGLYGMMNAKWINEIEVVSGVYQGYWQLRGYTNEAEYQTGSEIVVPGDAEITQRFGINGSTEVNLGTDPIAGIAFAGDRGISKVEVRTDGGSSWTDASLMDPLSQYTWVFWSADWNPPATGKYELMVRATDGTGKVQTATVSSPFPAGATGYHVVDVSVHSS